MDHTHKVVVGMSVDATDETQPGGVHFWRYQDSLEMTDWIPASGKSLAAGGLPITAVCH